ncbi:MAG: RND family efflux transporter MFP subunit [Rhodothermales bacterium]|jgi:RND family efflux transporter MFP subunit
MKEKLKSALIIVGILAGGFAISGVLAALKAEPPREIPPSRAPLVETQEIVRQSGPLTVHGSGTVRPKREVTLAAQVGGRIASVSPAFETGGSFRRGQVLATIEAADFENAVAVAEAELTQRKFELLQADEEVSVARDEWTRAAARSGIGSLPDSTELGRLAYREPQRELAAAGLRAAEARLRDARLRLDRTRIVAPFSGRMRTKQVDVGQFISPGQGVAVFYGTDEAEVAVQLGRAEINLIDPTWTAARNIPASVKSSAGRQAAVWSANVDRIEGSLDPSTRQINVIVHIPAPYAPSGGTPPLFIGTFVDVEIEGLELENFYKVPRSAVHEDSDGQNSVWLVENERLTMHPVTVIQQTDDLSIVTSPDLPKTLMLITTDVLVVADGMRVRTETSTP